MALWPIVAVLESVSTKSWPPLATKVSRVKTALVTLTLMGTLLDIDISLSVMGIVIPAAPPISVVNNMDEGFPPLAVT